MSDDDEPEVEVKENSEGIKKEPEDGSMETSALKQSSENEPPTTSFNWDDRKAIEWQSLYDIINLFGCGLKPDWMGFSALPLKAEIKEEIMDEETNDLRRDDADSKAVSSDGCTFLRKDENGRSVLRFYWIDAFEDPIKFPGSLFSIL
ncbi:unnamed protein product [Anisakis simplex]|uniref:Uncharacterized protein n=1 Tax=Anisakis simplex TaxID=6269 RepID=A0A0M3J9Y3_ANISI|nr:unnamed protein product [Anisakis simplex]